MEDCEPSFSRISLPIAVSRYFCLLLLGLSGMVGSSRPHSINGFKTVFLKRVRFVWPACLISACVSASPLDRTNSLTATSLGTDLGPFPSQVAERVDRRFFEVHAHSPCYSHIYSHINVVFLFSTFSLPFGVPTFSQHFQSPLLPPAVHDKPDCIAADIGAKLLHIGDAKGADHFIKGILHHCGFGAALRPLPLGPILEFAVGHPPDRKKVVEPRHYFVITFMPAGNGQPWSPSATESGLGL